MNGFGAAHPGSTPTTYRLLGALEVGRTAKLGGPRQRAVLAALLLRANDIASIGYLTRAAWADPPVAPESNLRTYVAGLRRILRDIGEDPSRLRTRSGGYSLAVDPGELDVLLFEELAGCGARSLQASDLETAAGQFRAALQLWRGQPLEGQTVGPALHAEIARLRDRRFAVIEQFCQARLELGDHAELASELQWLVTENPLREDLTAQLMSALYRSGRQAEALEVFRRTRYRLVSELGIEPGSKLTRLHQEILSTRETPGAPTTPGASAAPVPKEEERHRQLPMDINDFTGRRTELAKLRRLLYTKSPAVEICVIEGMGGVGKTRLAIHAAHQFARQGRYDEVQLWADLRGFDQAQPPVDPGTVLETFLHALGVPADGVPHDLEERAALYREQLSGKRALVLLDNAANEDQVRPLLPGGPECLVLVTTRRALGGLDGALSLALDVFGDDEAVELLTRILGADRVAAEPEAAEAIARSCGRLPLAVALVARRLRSRRCWRLADLANRLTGHGQRLDQITAGSREIRAVFELSYRVLPRRQQELFRMLSVHPGDDFTAESAAATVGVSPDRAEAMLDALLDAYLLEQITPGRYRFHDLLKDYARERAQCEDEPAERDAAMDRLLDWYLHTADGADRTLQPHRRNRLESPRVIRMTRDDAAAWLETEHTNLVCAVHAAMEQGRYKPAWQIPVALLGWFYLRKPWRDWIDTYRIALAAAQRLSDLRGQALALNGLGVAHSDLSQYAESITCHRRALAIERATGDRAGQAWNLNNLGVAYCDMQRLREAADCFRQSVLLHRETGNRHGEGIALSNLGDTYRGLDQLDAAMQYLDQAIEIQRANDDEAGQRFTLNCLGDVWYAKRQLRPAIDSYRQALVASRALGDRWQVAIVLTRMARPLCDSGEGEAAGACMTEARTILDKLSGGPKADQMRYQTCPMRHLCGICARAPGSSADKELRNHRGFVSKEA